MARVLVTGAAGFLGTAVCRVAADRGDIVVGLVRDGEHGVPFAGVSYVPVDWTDISTVEAELRRAETDVLVHCAGATPRAVLDVADYYDANVRLTWALLAAMRRIDCRAGTVIVSSASVYGPDPKIPTSEEEQLAPATHYAWSKMLAEETARSFAKLDESRVCIARLFNLLGTGEPPGSVVSDIAEQLDAGPDCAGLRLRETRSVRDYVDVQDAARGLLILAETGAAGEAYNVSSGIGTSIKDLAKMMLDVWESGAAVEEKQPSLTATLSVGSSDKLRELGWKPEHSIRDALEGLRDSRAQ